MLLAILDELGNELGKGLIGKAVHFDLDGKSYIVRTDLEGFTNNGFQAAGVRVPNQGSFAS